MTIAPKADLPFNNQDLERYVDTYHDQGFVIIPDLIPPSLLHELEEAADRVTDKARRGDWSNVRVVGKQFPPWDVKGGDDVWGVQNIMHPDLEEPVFAEWYGSPAMLKASAGLMGCKEEDMQFELFNILVNPLEKTYKLGWHRDDVKATATPEEEDEALKIKHHGIQWNAALYDDECLWAIPRSHSRIRSKEERDANIAGTDMPGAQIVGLKKGETVFYNNNILHVGKYNPSVKRRTLHGCYGSPPPGNTDRARVILQHDLAYTRDPSFRKKLPEQLKPMLDRLNGLQLAREGQAVEYSQDD